MAHRAIGTTPYPTSMTSRARASAAAATVAATQSFPASTIPGEAGERRRSLTVARSHSRAVAMAPRMPAITIASSASALTAR